MNAFEIFAPGSLETTTAQIFGKGPSLDRWLSDPPPKRENELRLGINETCTLVQDLDYGIVMDACVIDRMKGKWPAVPIVRPFHKARWDRYFPGGSVSFDLHAGDIRPKYAAMNASAPVLLWFLGHAGCAGVEMIGFDGFDWLEDHGGQVYADSVLSIIEKDNEMQRVSVVNVRIQHVLARWPGLPVSWWHRVEVDA